MCQLALKVAAVVVVVVRKEMTNMLLMFPSLAQPCRAMNQNFAVCVPQIDQPTYTVIGHDCQILTLVGLICSA